MVYLSQYFDDVDETDQTKGLPKPVQAKPYLSQYFDDEEPEQTEGDFLTGLKRGVDTSQAMGFGSVALVGSALEKAGAEGVGGWLKDKGLEGYRRNIEESEQYPKKHSFKDVYTGEAGIGGAIDWAQGTLGELLPSMATAASTAILGTVLAPGAGTGIGAFGARTFLKKTVDRLTKEALETQIKKGLIKEGAEEAAERQIRKEVTKQTLKKLSGKAGMGAGVLPFEAGGNYAGLLEEHGVDAPGSALFFGALATSLEYFGGNSRLVDVMVDGLAKGQGGIVKRAAKEIIRNMPVEAAQEAGQEVFSILNTVANTDEKFITADNIDSIIESAGAGGVGGFAGGFVQGVATKESSPADALTDKPEADAVDARNTDLLNRAANGEDITPEADLSEITQYAKDAFAKKAEDTRTELQKIADRFKEPEKTPEGEQQADWFQRDLGIPETDEEANQEYYQIEQDILEQRQPKKPTLAEQNDISMRQLEAADEATEAQREAWQGRTVEVPETDQSEYGRQQEEETYWSSVRRDIERQRAGQPQKEQTPADRRQQTINQMGEWGARDVEVPDTDQTGWVEKEQEEIYWNQQRRTIQNQQEVKKIRNQLNLLGMKKKLSKKDAKKKDQLESRLYELTGPQDRVKQEAEKRQEEMSGYRPFADLDQQMEQTTPNVSTQGAGQEIPAPATTQTAEQETAKETPSLNTDFIDNRIKELGSVEAVDREYSRDDKVSQYARQKAREVFGEDAQEEAVTDEVGSDRPGMTQNEKADHDKLEQLLEWRVKNPNDTKKTREGAKKLGYTSPAEIDATIDYLKDRVAEQNQAEKQTKGATWAKEKIESSSNSYVEKYNFSPAPDGTFPIQARAQALAQHASDMIKKLERDGKYYAATAGRKASKLPRKTRNGQFWDDVKAYATEAMSQQPEATPAPKAQPKSEESPSEVRAEGKQPWEMKAGEFGKQKAGNPFWDKQYPTLGDVEYLKDTQRYHREVVKQALADNKPVPPEVLKDYPDLAKTAAPEQSSPPTEGNKTDILPKSGQPFKNKGAAVLALKRAKAEDTHEVVEVEGGFVGRVRGDDGYSYDIPKTKYDIYKVRFKEGDKYAVRENMDNERGFGDSLYDTEAEAKKYISDTQKRDEANKAFREKQNKIIEAEKQKEQAKQAEREDLDGFDEGMNKLRRGQVQKVLNKKIMVSGVLKSRKQSVRELVAKGEKPSTREEDKIQPMTRRQFNNATQREQDAHDKRVKEAGKKTVYYIGGYDLGKVAYDYANYLIGKNKSRDESAEAKQPEPKTTPKKTKADVPDGAEIFGILKKKYPFKGISTPGQEKMYIAGIKKALKGKIAKWKIEDAISEIRKDARGPVVFWVTPEEIYRRLEQAGDVTKIGEQVETKQEETKAKTKQSETQEIGPDKDVYFDPDTKTYTVSEDTYKETIKGQTAKMDAAIDHAIESAPVDSDLSKATVSFEKPKSRNGKKIVDIKLNGVHTKDGYILIDNGRFWQLAKKRGSLTPEDIGNGYANLKEAKTFAEAYLKGEATPDGEITFKGQNKEYEYTIPNSRYHLNNFKAAVKRVKGVKYSTSEDYRMPHHKASTSEFGAPGHNLKDVFPDDIYGLKGHVYYGEGDPALDKKAVAAIRKMRNKPKAKIKIYRAVPKGVKEINPGDFVTTVKEYAVEHGESYLDDGYTVIEKTVNASDIYTDGNSIFEWGYDPEAKYQTANTDRTPAQSLTQKDIESRFPGQTIIRNDDGSISIRMKNGLGLKIKSIEHIGGEDIRLATEQGRMGKNGVILGKYTSNLITLNKNLADTITRDHELYHFLADNILTKLDRAVIKNKAKKLNKDGKFNFKWSDSMEENEANAFAQLLDERAKFRGKPLGKIIQKIVDFFDGLWNIGRMSARKLAREVESGRIYGQEGRSGQGRSMFSTAPKLGTKAFKNWFGDSKVVDEDGKPLVVYHWTDESFTEFDPSFLGKITEANTDNKNVIKMAKAGFWFTDQDISKETATTMGVPVYLSLQNPKMWRGDFWNLGKNINKIKQAGHDGIIVKDAEFGGTSYIAFSPTQIKSVYNRGTFDPSNPDIRYDTTDQDTAYLAAVERGDMETAGRMVEEAARAAGYAPKIRYHGTPLSQMPDTFDPNKIANRSTVRAFFFSPDKKVSSKFAGKTGKVGEFYLKIDNPMPKKEFIDLFKSHLGEDKDTFASRMAEDMQALGYDGLEGDAEVLVFNPNQIKSADPVTYDNQGNPIPLSQRFNPESRDVRYATDEDRSDTFAVEDNPSILDDFKYNVIDMLAPVEKVYRAIKKSVPEYADFLTKERLRVSKAKADIDEADRKYFTPIKRLIGLSRLTVADVDEFLYARHAPEGNARLRLTNARYYLNRLAEAQKGGKLKKKLDDLDAQFDLMDFPTNEIQESYKQILEEELANTSTERLEQATEKLKEFEAGLDDNPSSGELDKQKRLKRAVSKAQQELKVKKDWETFSAKPSGMTDAEAAKLNKKWANNKALKRIAALFDKMNNEALDISLAAGRMSQEEYDAIKGTFEYYAPLYREGFEKKRAFSGIGQGVKNLGTDVKIRGGSTKRAVHLLANAMVNHEKTIVNAKKAEVAKAFINFIKENQNDEFLGFEEPKTKAAYDAHGNIKRVPDRTLKDNETQVKVDGKTYIVFANPANTHAMRILDIIEANQHKSGPIVGALSRFNRILATVNTTWNPEFVISNLARDLQTAAYNLTDTEVSGMKRQIFKSVPSAMKGLKSLYRGDGSHEWAKIAKQYEKSGAKIGWIDYGKDIETKAKNLESQIDLFREGHTTKKNVRKLLDLVEDYNSIVENAVRLSTFKAALDAGVSESKAALTAKELTVNFNQKGAMGPVINSLYLFANAGIQGSTRIFRTIKNNPKKMAKLLGGTMATATALSIANSFIGGQDDDGMDYYDQVDDFIKTRNMIFMLPDSGGRYVKIPLPWGYNVFWALGTEIGDAMTQDGYKVMDGVSRMITTTMDAFNPLQSATLLQTLSPTIGDPFAQVAENKTFYGSPLMPGGNPFSRTPQPDSERYWRSARPVSKTAAKAMNAITGGDKIKPGLIDVSPETLDLAFDFFTGGAGRFIMDTVMLPATMITEGPTAKNTPGFRRVFGEKSEHKTATDYMDNITDVLRLREQIKEYPQNRLKFMRDKKYRLIGAAERAESNIRKLKKQLKTVKGEGRKKLIETRIEKIRKSFNQRFNQATS